MESFVNLWEQKLPEVVGGGDIADEGSRTMLEGPKTNYVSAETGRSGFFCVINWRHGDDTGPRSTQEHTDYIMMGSNFR